MSYDTELLFLIRQFCEEENLQKTVHMLEQETGFFFDMKYFEELVMTGNLQVAENYLSGFTRIEGNQYSVKMYFEIRKQKFFEALEKHDLAVALDILLKDLKVFASSNEMLYGEMTSLLTMDDFREHHSLSTYGDVISARRRLIEEIKLLIEANPHFRRKLEFPQLEKSRLCHLINQSLNWQHNQCAHPKADPQINNLFSDHKCSGQLNKQIPLPIESKSASVSPLIGKLIDPPPIQPESQISGSAVSLGTQNNLAATLEGIKESCNVSRISLRMSQMVSGANVPAESQNLNFIRPKELPKTVERCMDMCSSPTSMDFHPYKETLLLVGNIIGQIELWDICSEVKLFWNAFVIWKRETISVLFLNELDEDPHIVVNRVLWSPYGSLFGVAYSKHIVQLYSYHAMSNRIEKQLEIDAHSGAVNDLAFSSPYEQLLVITCGEDKFIQVWDAVTGSKQYTFEGHGGPVYSLCSHLKEDIHFLFSTSTNGEIKAWLFDDTGPRVVFDAPGYSCVRMAYSADGKRLFSCGTNKDGDSYMVEWNDTEGYITRTYHGLSKSSTGIVQFSTSRNRFLVAGDEHLIKVWEMDNVKILTVVDAGGGLTARPYVCFNKEGTLLAVFADNSKIKILANDVGSQMLRSSAFCSVDSTGYLPKSLQKGKNMKGLLTKEQNKVLNTKEYSRIAQVSRCQSLSLPSDVKKNKICRLVYTNAGNGILALAAEGIHLYWKWLGNEYDNYGQATTDHAPHLWQPRSGLMMINNLTDDPFQLVSPCLAISKNDSYIVSASGKMVSLFNAITFERMRSCLLPPPAATCIAFYPSDNNIVAIGMDDSTILVYNVRESELIHKLSGHLRRVSGLAFSNTLQILISSAVDTQIIVWDSIMWEKKKSISLQICVGWWLPSESSETKVQFHRNQKHFLAVHETQLAIYETRNLERMTLWTIRDFRARISHGTFSCESQLVYAVMGDGIVMIFSASDLNPRFQIDPSVYLPTNIGSRVYPIEVAAHPQKPNQFALGLSNGQVIVVEPHESEKEWGVLAAVGKGLTNRIIID